ncbi:hypothetical protein M2137_000424 [Parabacteroides sp. PFB2-10]|nr:hypothetical protein [Parabacteroides sp. PFB2-10]
MQPLQTSPKGRLKINMGKFEDRKGTPTGVELLITPSEESEANDWG